ncbi:hypothetical protein Clacol_008248 [Clathrus columnatus]|uniref:Elongator complex protein 5 n=1 Tax=Clathrus columnatus TaxID=1419009 RepID=A0AAV5AM45_9AGAM|nr:hypothetical protein Clacol_008248 [Clathrus columnatus]
MTTRAEGSEVEAMIWGSEGIGWASGDSLVMEVVSRHPSGRQTVERTLEGCHNGQYVKLSDLPELKHLWKSGNSIKSNDITPSSITHDLDLSFNLNLSEKQQSDRAQVPLPYVHEGNPISSTIYYDPDSADDIDEDDPDEDLDI